MLPAMSSFVAKLVVSFQMITCPKISFSAQSASYLCNGNWIDSYPYLFIISVTLCSVVTNCSIFQTPIL